MQPLLKNPTKDNMPTSVNDMANLRYQAFVVLWVTATLFHSVKKRELDNDFSLILLSLAGFYLLMNPKSIGRFVAFLLMQFTVIVIYMPYVSNHWIFSGFVCLTLLASIFLQIAKEKSFDISRKALWKTFAPIIRIELIILYFFVVWHKLNYDFFNPAISCGTDLIKDTMGIGYLHVPDAILHLNAYATVIIETLIPLMLIFRKTRSLGVLIGLLFHNVIAYNNHNGYYDFSSAIFAIYFLFITPAFSVYLRLAISKFLQFKDTVYRQLRTFNPVNVIMIIGIAIFSIGLIMGVEKFINDYVLIFWTLFSVTYIAIYIKTLLSEKDNTDREKLFKVRYPLLLIIPVLLLVNGFSPYLGFKTENSFAMYSNLRTEAGLSNHFFMPADIQLFDYQKDLVEINATSDPVLLEYAEKQRLITFFDLNKRVSTAFPDYVSYTYKGENHDYVAGQKDQMGLEKRPHFILRKLLRFRTINSGINTCTH